MRACVTVLIAGLVLAACADSSSEVHSPLAAAVGYRWQVTGGTDASGHLDVAPGSHPAIGFTPDGWVLGDDTVNSLQGRYRVTAQGPMLPASASSTASPSR